MTQQAQSSVQESAPQESPPHDSGTDASAQATSSGGPKLRVWHWLMLWLAFWVGVPTLLHAAVHGVFNGWHFLITLFLAINLLITIWEISLFFRITEIEHWHSGPARETGRPRRLYTERVTPKELLSTLLWARVWSNYAHYDKSYAERKSFGFAADIGNGFSTLLPNIFLLFAMTFDLTSPVIVGIVGLVIFYQKFYLTALYFFIYIFNKRYEGLDRKAVYAVVGGSNSIWLVFPLVGMYVFLQMILDNSYAIIWS